MQDDEMSNEEMSQQALIDMVDEQGRIAREDRILQAFCDQKQSELDAFCRGMSFAVETLKVSGRGSYPGSGGPPKRPFWGDA